MKTLNVNDNAPTKQSDEPGYSQHRRRVDRFWRYGQIPSLELGHNLQQVVLERIVRALDEADGISIRSRFKQL
jgi:hypothetical protein